MDGVAVRLAKLKREAEKEWRRKWRQKLRQAAPANAAEWRALAGEVLRAMLNYQHGQTSVWLALLTSAFLTAGVVTAYAVWLARKFTNRGGRGGRALVMPLAKWVALPLVVFYCGYSLLYLASVNAKSEP